MKKDILFLCQYFYPEYNSSATLPFDTAKHLAAAGFTVEALCGYPKEYLKQGWHVKKREVKDGVFIRRLYYLHANRKAFIGRLLNFISFTVSAMLHLFQLKNYRCVMVYSNPPVLPLVAVLAKKLFKTKIVYVSYDVYPEIAYAANTFGEAHPIAKVMRRINHVLFKEADAVVALSDDMKAFLAAHREIEPNKIRVIPNWASEEEANLPSAEVLPATGKPFKVAYCGNMGLMQEMSTLTDACHRLRSSDIFFSFTGHGSKSEDVKQAVKDCPNAKVNGFLTGDAFRRKVAAASLCVVTLEGGLKGLCAPSKYYSYLYAGKPVLFIGEEDNYLYREIQEEGIGAAVSIGDTSRLVQLLQQFKENPAQLQHMGSRAMALYRRKYQRSLCNSQYAALLQAIMERTE